MQILNYIILAVVFLAAIILHEVAHGYVAYLFGDDTAKRAGRLTLNPISHMDVMGTIFLIIVLVFGFGIGWAKPVPINPLKFRNLRLGLFCVALAGPAANLVQAALSLVITALYANGVIVGKPIETLVTSMFFLNMLLATFNLVPIPPLDGSRIISSVLPFKLMRAYNRLEPYGIMIVLLALFVPFPGLGAPPLRLALNSLYGIQEAWFNHFVDWVTL
jgi:Zn-dependent protease